MRSDDPVIVFEPIPCYRTTCDVPDGEHLVPLGVAREVRAPDDAVVITWGAMVDVAVAAADARAASGAARSVGVIDLRTLAPLDVDTIVRAAERCGRVVVVHEAPLTGGLRRRGRGHAAGGGLLLVGGADPAGRGRRRGLGAAAGRGLVPTRRGARRRRRSTRRSMPDVPDSLPYLLPDLGEGMAEAELVQWRVAVGDHVTRDQIVVHVQTDKAEVELPVPASGTVVRLGAEVGDLRPGRRPLLELIPDDGTALGGTPVRGPSTEPFRRRRR